jgi:hypothetical protein
LIYTLHRRLMIDHEPVRVFVRSAGDERLLVALNFSEKHAGLTFKDDGCRGRILISTTTPGRSPAEPVENAPELRRHEGLVIELAEDARVPEAVSVFPRG